MTPHKTLIFIPTYNEAENVANIYRQLKELALEADILFLDDSSPDGTGQIIDELVRKDHNLHVIHRSGKQGIGSAHQVGISWAYEKKYESLVTMDCDFTHSPSYILDFVAHSSEADIVIGSRYMQKESLSSWNIYRKSLTHLGHFLTVHLLKMPFDASGAFRLYNLRKIEQECFRLVTSTSYSFFFESLFILNLNRKSIKEIPIDLPARTYGTSKMTLVDAWKSFKYLLYLYKRMILNKNQLILKRQIVNEKS